MADVNAPLLIDGDTGAGVQPVTAAILTHPASGGAVQLVQVEDEASADADPGIVGLVIRDDALAANAGVDSDGDYTALRVNNTGALWIKEASALDVSGAVVTVDLAGNNDVTTELAGTTAVAAMADDDANPTVLPIGAYVMGYDSGNTNWNRVEVDDAGHLQVDVLTGGGSDTPTNPVTYGADGTTPTNVAAGASGDIDTIEAASKKLAQVTVWSSVAYRVRLYTVDNAVESTDPFAVGGGQAHQPWVWEPPHRDYATLGSTAGLDAFRAEVTNLDDSLAADFYAVFLAED